MSISVIKIYSLSTIHHSLTFEVTIINRQQLFDTWAKTYDSSVQEESEFPFDGYQDVLNKVVELASLKQGDTLLDLGVGTGNLSAKFIELGCRVTGIDYSSQMLAQARKKFPKTFFAQADLTKPLGFKGTFDCLVSAYVFHEFDLKSKLDIIERSFKYLKEEARLIIADIAFASRHDRALAYELLKHLWDETEHYWAADETREVLSEDITMTYEQVSSCAGVFVFSKGRDSANNSL